MKSKFLFLIVCILALSKVAVAAPVKATVAPEPTSAQCIPAGTPTPKPITQYCKDNCPNGIELSCAEVSNPKSIGPCTIVLPTSLCLQLGLSSGIIPPGNATSFFDCTKLNVNNQDDAENYYFCCAINHELVHACRSRENEGSHDQVSMRACEERDGNTNMIACANAGVNRICNQGKTAEGCHHLCRAAAHFAINRIWDNCNCNLAAAARDCDKDLNSQLCCNCNAECLNNPSSYLSRIPPICLSKFTASDLSQMKEHCADQPTDGHGCNYMSGGFGVDPNLCKKPTPQVTVVAY